MEDDIHSRRLDLEFKWLGMGSLDSESEELVPIYEEMNRRLFDDLLLRARLGNICTSTGGELWGF